jgi:hypothetical protein
MRNVRGEEERKLKLKEKLKKENLKKTSETKEDFRLTRASTVVRFRVAFCSFWDGELLRGEVEERTKRNEAKTN